MTRDGDYVEQHFMLDEPRVDEALEDRCLQIDVKEDTDVLTIDLSDKARDRMERDA